MPEDVIITLIGTAVLGAGLLLCWAIAWFLVNWPT